MVGRDGKCGYIDRSGAIVISPQWEDATDFRNGRAKVKRNGKYRNIDIHGKLLRAK